MTYTYLVSYTWQVGTTVNFGNEVIDIKQPINGPVIVRQLEYSISERIKPQVLIKYSKPDMTEKDKKVLVKMVNEELKINILVPTLLKQGDATH